jgi:hypothetical protein
VIVARVDHRQSVLAEVDPVIKAHHEGVRISGVFVSITHMSHSTCQLHFPNDSSSFSHVSRGEA